MHFKFYYLRREKLGIKHDSTNENLLQNPIKTNAREFGHRCIFESIVAICSQYVPTTIINTRDTGIEDDIEEEKA